jgi:hypothetical protein
MTKRNTKEWQAIFQQHIDSGLSVVDFCLQHNINKKYFNDRKRYWLNRQPDELVSPFIQVNKPHTLSASAIMSLELGEAKLLLPVNTEPTWLAQLLKALSV